MSKKSIFLCLCVLIVCVEVSQAQERFPNREISEKLFFNISSIKTGELYPTVSPDMRHIALLDVSKKLLGRAKWMVFIDGKEGKKYDAIVKHSPTFSPDGKNLAYLAEENNKQFVVVDGKEESRYDRIGIGREIETLATAPGGSYWIKTASQVLAFSPDSKRVAYTAEKGKKWFVVVDGKEGKQYDAIDPNAIVFSPDSKKIGFAALKEKRWLV